MSKQSLHSMQNRPKRKDTLYNEPVEISFKMDKKVKEKFMHYYKGKANKLFNAWALRLIVHAMQNDGKPAENIDEVLKSNS